jgi:hypothetical protein
VKFLFFSILLGNIVFFFWEYRKGAPEIYLPTDIERKASNDNQQQIFLLSELPAKVVSLEIDSANNNEVSVPDASFIESKQARLANNDFVGPLNNIGQENVHAEDKNMEFIGPLLLDESVAHISEAISIAKPEVKITELKGDSEPAELNTKTEVLFACYPLREGEYSEQMFATTNKGKTFKFELVQQEQQYISSYLVLTLAANSYQEAKAWEMSIKQQGINELWLFTRGSFKWRISLGLFSTQSKAEKVKASFSRRIPRELEVVPSHQTRVLTEVKISGQEKDISLFKGEFSQYFKQESECISK